MTNEIIEAGKTKLFDYDFENGKSQSLNWACGTWCNLANTFVMPSEIVTEDEISFMQLGSSSLRYGGLYLPPIENTAGQKIELEFDAKKKRGF